MQDVIPSEWRVVPFGNLRIKGYLHLPEAYRSLSRPSSPPRAKASAMRPCLLSFKRFILVLVLVVELLPSINIAYSNTYGLIYTFSFRTKITFCLLHHVIDLSLWWRITDSNRWPPACKARALASWANPPFFFAAAKVSVFLRSCKFLRKFFSYFLSGSPRQSWTADLYIISVAL